MSTPPVELFVASGQRLAESSVGTYAWPRDLPATGEAWLYTIGEGLIFVGVVGGVAYAYSRVILRRWNKERARLENESAVFTARWPRQRLWGAPYVELEAEADRCRRIIHLQEQTKLRYRNRCGIEFSDEMNATQAWLATIDAASTGAAAREGRASPV